MQTIEPEHLKACPIYGGRKEASRGTVFSDPKAAAGVFADMRKTRKAGGEVVIEKKVAIPVFSTGIGFLDTVEGCTLANCKEPGVYEIAKKTFSELPYEVKHQLTSAPRDGEFAERACFWKELLQPVMTSKQCHAAMLEILDWYLHIKRMRKGGAA